MKRRNDLYNLGNDYAQTTSAYFVVEETAESIGKEPYEVYSDGLYHYTVKPVYELSGGEDALNKRILNVLPQSGWADNEITLAMSGTSDGGKLFSKDYATAETDATVTVEGGWKKPCGC